MEIFIHLLLNVIRLHTHATLTIAIKSEISNPDSGINIAPFPQ